MLNLVVRKETARL